MAMMGKKLIALCSTAIGIVYAAGYIVTEPQSLQAMTQTESAMSSTISLGEQAHPLERHQTSRTSMPKVSQPSTASPKYQDGSYTGSGTNRFGTVEVAVTIKTGSIANVEITRSATRYPVTYIQALPQKVVEKQSANVDTVSGATNSSQDFIQAVLQALGKAQQLS
jgi:uncharacterized protein with FMN-binding domain